MILATLANNSCTPRVMIGYVAIANSMLAQTCFPPALLCTAHFVRSFDASQKSLLLSNERMVYMITKGKLLALYSDTQTRVYSDEAQPLPIQYTLQCYRCAALLPSAVCFACPGRYVTGMSSNAS